MSHSFNQTQFFENKISENGACCINREIISPNNRIPHGDFYFIKNGQVIIKEDLVRDYLVCVVDYGKSVKHLIENKDKMGSGDLYFNFEESLENYFVIVMRRIEAPEEDYSDFINPNLYDTHISQLKIYYNGVLISTIDNYKLLRINTCGEILCIQNKGIIVNITQNALKIRPSGEIILLKSAPPREILQISHIDFKEQKEFNFSLIDNKSYVRIYFHKRECDSFYIAKEFCKNADVFEILPNKFDDDIETVNYRAKYKKDRINDIAFLLHCLNRVDRSVYGTSAFSTWYNDGKNKPNTCAGSAVYNIPIMEYYKGLEGDFTLINEFSLYALTREQRENYKELVKLVYRKYDKPVDYTKFPDEFIKGLVCEDLFCIKLDKFVKSQILIQDKKATPVEKSKILQEKEAKLKEKYKALKQKLIENGTIKNKWKSEVELFTTVSSIYPDAIYQYRNKWLGLQSLDVFIPSLSLGIEYQGRQHYEEVDFFGGEEAFKYRQELDEQKKKLCKENNVKLIEWHYTESINKILLKKKIKELLNKEIKV